MGDFGKTVHGNRQYPLTSIKSWNSALLIRDPIPLPRKTYYFTAQPKALKENEKFDFDFGSSVVTKVETIPFFYSKTGVRFSSFDYSEEYCDDDSNFFANDGSSSYFGTITKIFVVTFKSGNQSLILQIRKRGSALINTYHHSEQCDVKSNVVLSDNLILTKAIKIALEMEEKIGTDAKTEIRTKLFFCTRVEDHKVTLTSPIISLNRPNATYSVVLSTRTRFPSAKEVQLRPATVETSIPQVPVTAVATTAPLTRVIAPYSTAPKDIECINVETMENLGTSFVINNFSDFVRVLLEPKSVVVNSICRLGVFKIRFGNKSPVGCRFFYLASACPTERILGFAGQVEVLLLKCFRKSGFGADSGSFSLFVCVIFLEIPRN